MVQMRHVTMKAIWESAGPLSLVSTCTYSSVSAATQGLHKHSKDGICSQSGAHRHMLHLSWWAVTPALLPCHHLEYGWTNLCPKCHVQGGRQVSTQVLLSTGGKRTEGLVLTPLLGMDGSRGQHSPQPLCLSASKRSHLLEYEKVCSALN